MAVMPAPKPLRFRKLEPDWWRALRDGRTYDIYRDEGLDQFRAVIRDTRDRIIVEATFDLSQRGAHLKARRFLEADGQVPGIRRKVVA